MTGRDEAAVDRALAAARLAALDEELRSCDSATLVLERWCRAHLPVLERMPLVARTVRRAAAVPPEAQGGRLRAAAGEPVRHRRVRLACGTLVLSEADNWYLPGRLAPAMNRILETTEVPFGRVVRGLRFRRRLLEAERLWRPAEDDARGIPPHVLRHHALLVDAAGAPLCELVETYTRAALLLPEPVV